MVRESNYLPPGMCSAKQNSKMTHYTEPNAVFPRESSYDYGMFKVLYSIIIQYSRYYTVAKKVQIRLNSAVEKYSLIY